MHGLAYNPVAFGVKARHNTVVSRHCDCWEHGSDIRDSDASFPASEIPGKVSELFQRNPF